MSFGFAYMSQHFWRVATNYKTREYQTQFKLEVANTWQIKVKTKSSKNVNLSTSLTKHNAFKLPLQSKENMEFDLSKVTNKHTKVAWTEVTQMYSLML